MSTFVWVVIVVWLLVAAAFGWAFNRAASHAKRHPGESVDDTFPAEWADSLEDMDWSTVRHPGLKR